MNLPLKLVDLVTLLFFSLLVVIIVFIFLQRNLKRVKLRNVKDSHFLSCKSIPKELLNAIEKKYLVSNSYKEPLNLLAEFHLKQPEEKTKSYIYRMKAFEVSKNLEKALMECGYKRPNSTKFEHFLDDLHSYDDQLLPKNLLIDFSSLYIWALHDPIEFSKEQLRKINLLVNKIIKHLALNKKDDYNEIIQYQLELDPFDDLNYDNFFTNINHFNLKHMNSVNFENFNATTSNSNTATTTNNNNNSNGNTNNNNINFTIDSHEKIKLNSKKFFNLNRYKTNKNINDNKNEPSTSANVEINSNLENKQSKVTKKFFHKSTTSGSSSSSGALGTAAKITTNENESNLFSYSSKLPTKDSTGQRLKEKLKSSSKYEEMKVKLNEKDRVDSSEIIELNKRTDWVNESIRNYDSENEEIPLVSKKASSNYHHSKKKSSHSNITIVPLKTTSTGINQNMLKNDEIKISVNEKNGSISTNNNFDKGEENEGFNITNETII